MSKTKLLFSAAALGLTLFASQAFAAPTNCSAYVAGSGANPTETPGDANDALYKEDMTLNGQASDDCYGHVNVPGNNSLASVVTYANTTNPLFGAGWTGVYRIDSGTNQNAWVAAFGLEFRITGLTFGTADTQFFLEVRDVLPASPSLPVLMDLVLTLKGAQETDFFYFNDEFLDTSNEGTYSMAITNNNGGVQGLSDISVLGRDVRDYDCRPGDPLCEPNETPEPGSLALVGLALLGAGYARRRRS